MDQVLLVEDSPDTQTLLKNVLGTICQLSCAANAKSALEQVQTKQYDLVLLDVHLPDINGYELCGEIRNHPGYERTPIFFLTVKSEVVDRIAGFSLGADDYIVKPFEPLELRARVEARLKKERVSKAQDQVLRRGPISVNVSQFEVLLDIKGQNKKIELTPHEFKLLYNLLLNPDRILSRQQLLGKVWGMQTFVEERTVDKHMSSLRKKLTPYSKHLVTISGVGYKFTLNV